MGPRHTMCFRVWGFGVFGSRVLGFRVAWLLLKVTHTTVLTTHHDALKKRE